MLIAFDLDGTLIDSRADLARSTNDTLVHFGAEPLSEERAASFVGDGARMLVSRALTAANLSQDILDEALATFLDIYNRRMFDVTRPYDGVLDVLAHAGAHAALGVITNKPQAPTDRLLHAFEIAAKFQWVIGGDTSFGRKPDPAALMWMMKEAGVTPEQTLYVGDSDVDAETARRCGAHFCLAEYGFGQSRGATPLLPDEFRAITARDICAAIDLVAATAKERA